MPGLLAVSQVFVREQLDMGVPHRAALSYPMLRSGLGLQQHTSFILARLPKSVPTCYEAMTVDMMLAASTSKPDQI